MLRNLKSFRKLMNHRCNINIDDQTGTPKVSLWPGESPALRRDRCTDRVYRHLLGLAEVNHQCIVVP